MAGQHETLESLHWVPLHQSAGDFVTLRWCFLTVLASESHRGRGAFQRIAKALVIHSSGTPLRSLGPGILALHRSKPIHVMPQNLVFELRNHGVIEDSTGSTNLRSNAH